MELPPLFFGPLCCIRPGVADVHLGFPQWNLIGRILTVAEDQIIVGISPKLDWDLSKVSCTELKI